MNLSTLIEEIPRIGPQYQKKLKKLGIKTVQDLLFHFPHRYEDFSNIVPISKVKNNQTCCVQGKILKLENTRTWKKRMFITQAVVGDKTGAIKVVWFNQPYLVNTLKEGDLICLAGKTTFGSDGVYLSSPAYEKIKSSDLVHTGRLIPVYPETEGLSSRWLRFIIKPILDKLESKLVDFLPESVKETNELLPIQQAIRQVHFPDSLKMAERAKERFSFEELFFISLLVQKEREKLSLEKAVSVPINLSLLKKFTDSLPFKLTDAQRKSAWQILKDMEKPRPMNRLLEGDVGSGKTIVAVMAALNTIKAGHQVALMAPTEILAKQHFKNINQLLKEFNLKIGLLTGKEKTKGELDLSIGTHALIQEKIKFKNLALVILDEQHRFGVEQRAKLVKNQKTKNGKKHIPHLLSMTATPIPRTLALTVYGDLDLSLIDELPKGRKKIITKIIPPEQRKKAYDFIRQQVKEGRQAFVVCPRIEPGNNKEENKKDVLGWAEVKAVKEEYEKLSKTIFPDLKIDMLHGKMKTEEKEKVMNNFKDKKTDILVSTSVVEVGVDIPNASLMMIEGAERFGLAQLHQFRGRVGRSEYQSFCFLFTDSPAKKTSQRLKALTTSENGFELAEKDLQIRGPGNFLGTRQWGIPDLAMASLKDVFLVAKTKNSAKEILEKDPQLKKHPFLKEKLEEFRKKIHLE